MDRFEEIIVMAGFARYIADCEIRRPGASPGGAATPSAGSGKFVAAASERRAGLCRLSETEAGRVD